MRWSQALSDFLDRHQGELSWREFLVMTDYKEDNVSIPGLWSWRGKIWAKCDGRYPEPSAVGMQANDTFFDKDYICHSRWMNSDGKLLKEEWFHHGRRLTERSKLWAKRPLA